MFLRYSAPETLTKPEPSRLLRTVARDGPTRDLPLFSLAPARACGSESWSGLMWGIER